MRKLLVYPTSRAIREKLQQFKQSDSLLPTLMRMDEFEQKALLLGGKSIVNPLQRVLLLKKAANFKSFGEFKFRLELVRFFGKSDALLKFFEELSSEKVDYNHLANADSYAEFSEHLAILEHLQSNYEALLNKSSFTDKTFIPKSYKINDGFVGNYELVEIFLEGYLSLFELELLEQISKKTQVVIHYTTSKFNTKMQERFQKIGIELPNNMHVTFNLSEKGVLEAIPNTSVVNPIVYVVEERLEQITQAFVAIEDMVQSGIRPENIVLVLPDEGLKEHFMLFDRYNNLNFAMGYSYSKKRAYKLLEAIHSYWQNPQSIDRKRIEKFGLDIEQIDNISTGAKVELGKFFDTMDSLEILDLSTSGLDQIYSNFKIALNDEKLTPKEWLFLWLQELSNHTIDDVRGGLITVMGVLETRGVDFAGVVIVDFNDGIVPASSSKDQFLNSSVRIFAGLPTKADRESLQQQYYKRLLEGAKKSTIIYATAQNRLPSKFLYELKIDKSIETKAPMELFYNMPSQIVQSVDPIVVDFDATKQTWSASRLKTYLDCKRKFYYRYIKHIKQKPQDEMNDGTLLHGLLEKLFEVRDSFESYQHMREETIKVLSALLPNDDAKSNYQRELLLKKLEPFIESQIKHFKSTWKVISKEKLFRGKIAGLEFRGIIDRIDQNSTDTLIIDYKSGSTKEANRTKNLEKLTEFQMSVYDFLTTRRFQNRTLGFLKILDGGNMEEITALEEKNQLLLEHIEELKKNSTLVASKCDELSKCKYCEFTLMCGRGAYV